MDKKNIGLLHGLFFATFAAVLVYCGEQAARTSSNYGAIWVFKAASITTALGFTLLAISFIPAGKSNQFAEESNKQSRLLASKYYYNGDELEWIHRNTVIEIEFAAKHAANYAALQNKYNSWNNLFTYSSATFMVVTVILFSVGVCLL